MGVTRSAADAWAEIRDKANQLQASGTPLLTLRRETPNVIVGVTDSAITRQSAEAKSDGPSAVRRSQIESIWNELSATGTAVNEGQQLRFAWALVGRLIDGVEFFDSPFRLEITDELKANQRWIAPGEHILVKWNPKYNTATIALHQHIAESTGGVWWGVFTESDQAVGSRRVQQFQKQIADGVPTYAYLHRLGTDDAQSAPVTRARLKGFEVDASRIDTDRMPDYYDASRCKLFLCLTDFEPLPGGWDATHLRLSSNPDDEGLSVGSLTNQTNPMYVTHLGGALHELSGEPPLTVRMVSGASAPPV